MSKIYRFFKFTAWAMIVVGAFSILTGFLSLVGITSASVDKMSGQSMFNFINSGVYFMLCGVIHIAAGIMGFARLKGHLNGPFCIIFGVFTLAWQLAAFIYLFTLYYISVRIALMVVLPVIYLFAIIVAELKIRLAPSKNAQNKNQADSAKTFVVKNAFKDVKFSYKRKSVNKPKFEGKRHSNKFKGMKIRGKRRNPLKKLKRALFGRK